MYSFAQNYYDNTKEVKEMSESDMKYSKILKVLCQIIPCTLTAILTGIYALEIWNELNLVAINVLCLPLFFSELALGFVESKNIKKALFFLGAIFIGTVIGGLNLWTNYQTIGNLRLNELSGWSLVWIILLLIAVVSILIILIRLLHWSQEQWLTVKKECQECRLQIKEFWIKYIHAIHKQRLKIQQIKQEHKQQLQENKQNGKNEKQEIKHQNKKEKLEFKINRDKDRREGKNDSLTKIELGLRGGVLFLIVSGFFIFPCINNLPRGFRYWIANVKNFLNTFRDKEIFYNAQQALFYYILLYIIAVSTIVIIGYLIIHMIHKPHKKKNNSFNFIEEYQLPIALLVVFGSFLYVITEGENKLEEINKIWQNLLFIILPILVLFVAIEIVRIFVVQCGEPHSLLKKIIFLIFVTIWKFLSELLLGIITNFRIQMVISSLFALIFPESEEGENSFNERLNTKLNQFFNKEISKVKINDSISSSFKKNHSKRIWRRGKK